MKFAHKGLKRFARSEDKRGIVPSHAARLKFLISALQGLEKGWPMSGSFDKTLHALKCFNPKVSDTIFSVSVSGAWRLIFQFDGKSVNSVNYLNYH